MWFVLLESCPEKCPVFWTEDLLVHIKDLIIDPVMSKNPVLCLNMRFMCLKQLFH